MTQLASRNRYQRALNHLEALEPRTLLSAAPTISSYTVPNVGANFGAYDAAGNLWVLNFNNPRTGYSLDEIGANHAVVDSVSIDNNNFAPGTVVAGANGIFYATDSAGASGFGSIDAIDTLQHTVTRIYQGTSGASMPQALTVTGDGALWFTGFDQEPTGTTNVIGRIDPSSNGAVLFTSGPALSDSYAFTLAPSGADSVWVGFTSSGVQNDTGFSFGQNHIIAASFNGSTIQIDHTYDVNTSDPIANQFNFISSIADGGDGTVWFTLANNNLPQAPQGAPDQIVLLDTNTSTQTAYVVPGASPTNQLSIGSLNFDANNNLWFSEANGSQFGLLNTAAGAPDPLNGDANFTMTDSPTPDQQTQMVANPAGTQLSILTQGADASVGYTIVQIDLPVQTITFGFTSVSTVSAQEKSDIAGTLLATFVAPDPTTSYNVTINWGDNTSSVIAATSLGNNNWAIVAPSKTFATQGNYGGTLTVTDGSTVVGSTSLTSTISDIPLNVTSLTVSPIFLRIVTAVGTFTDDAGLSLNTWTATLNWGDNTTSKGIIVRDPTQAGHYLVLGVHQYRTRGTYSVRLTVTTSEVNADIANSTLTSSVTAR